MEFRIANTFTDSLARLTGDEQKAAKTTAFDLQLNPVSPGMQLPKIEKSKDKNFWSVRVGAALARAGLPFKVLDEGVEITHGQVSISSMHLAKGLEFRAVAVMACDDEVIPLQARIETAAEDSDREEVYNTERHLLYVTCTRACDHLLVTGVGVS